MSASLNPVRFSVRSRSDDISRNSPSAAMLPQLDDLGELLQEPADRSCVSSCSVSTRPAAPQRAEQRPHPPIVRHHQPLAQRASRPPPRRGVVGAGREQAAALAELERAHGLEERFLERAADRHRLAHRLHLRRQRAVGLRELLEVPARELDDDVVDGRLERGRRQPRDVVRDLVEVIAERELGGDLRDREAGGLRRQRRRPRHARVHLDGDDAAVLPG